MRDVVVVSLPTLHNNRYSYNSPHAIKHHQYRMWFRIPRQKRSLQFNYYVVVWHLHYSVINRFIPNDITRLDQVNVVSQLNHEVTGTHQATNGKASEGMNTLSGAKSINNYNNNNNNTKEEITHRKVGQTGQPAVSWAVHKNCICLRGKSVNLIEYLLQ